MIASEHECMNMCHAIVCNTAIRAKIEQLLHLFMLLTVRSTKFLRVHFFFFNQESANTELELCSQISQRVVE